MNRMTFFLSDHYGILVGLFFIDQNMKPWKLPLQDRSFQHNETALFK